MNDKSSEYIVASVQEQIESCDLPETVNRWLIAVSGGCDSMALMYALTALREVRPEKFSYLHVAHLNHQLRGRESDADADFVAEQAKQLNLPVTVGSIDIAAARAGGESIEAAARRRRFGFLAETARKFKCQIVALGHNADDQAETILHRILRGTGIRGLSGIWPVRTFIDGQGQEKLWLVRPLLLLRRAEIEQYLHKKGIAWRQDQSNQSTQFTRNRIRHDLLPHLADRYNPRVVEALLQLGQTAKMCSVILGEDAGKDLAEITLNRSAECLTLHAVHLAAKPRIQQVEIIYQALLSLQIPQRKIGFKHISDALNILNGPPGADNTLQFPYGLTVQCTKDQMIFHKTPTGAEETTQSKPEEVILPLSGEMDLPEGFVWIAPASFQANPAQQIVAESITAGRDCLETFRRQKNCRQEIFDLDKLQGALRLRCRREGERFWPLGASGPKKLGDFFTDAKIPIRLRDRIGLICDDQGILWILGLRISERVKITCRTNRVLKITIK
ncbi:MAG: hypothetical protein AMJ79_08545 [Phycisphaerae bacterium SM23_30]|nr:MAG: hypothetical protein AMJ79_08545 [Phycisphaerae bacterium SM23_30]